MLPNLESHYLLTRDKEKIFYQTNFKIDDYNPEIPTLVFNYGLVCNVAHWEKQVPFFHEQGYQLITHDLRGHFRSSGDDSIEKLTFDNFANDIKEILSHLNIGKVFMLGHSMGVNITLEFSKQFPENLLGQVLISGSIVPPQGVMFDSNLFDHFTPIWKYFVDKFPKAHDLMWKTTGTNPLIVKLIHQGGFNTKQVPVEFIEVYLNRVGQLKPEVFFQCFQEMHDHDIINYIESIKTPTLIMGGDFDQVIPNYLQYILLDKMDNSEFYLIKDGSHVPQVDFFETVNERIDYFFNKE